MKKILLTIPAAAMAFAASAHSVPFEENFDGDWTVNFPMTIELDHLPPLSYINSMFMNGQGISMPWWPGKDSSSATDRFIMSHAMYQTPGQSNDWLVSRPIDITGSGFTLTFEAQSAPIRSVDNLSDLWVYITEKPVTAENLPSEPVMHIEKVPYGASVDDVQDDFTQYSLDLEPWAGKTIYLTFANLNYDNDILCLNNILIRRLDNIGLTASSPDYVVEGDYNVEGALEGMLDPGIKNWTLTFEATGTDSQSISGSSIGVGETVPFTFTGKVDADDISDWKLTLTGDDTLPVILKGSTTGVLFEPTHRVLFEEATGTWCGNCPNAIYNIECMLDDEEMKDRVIPVSVHINGSPEDHMVETFYSGILGLTAAPTARIDREGSVAFFGPVDYVFNKNNELSVGGRIYKRMQKLTFADIELEAEFNASRTEINCKVNVIPNLTMDTDQHGIGFILTENNVGLDDNREWMQHNYHTPLDGKIDSDMNGWTKLPEEVKGVRYQDVARGIWGFNGLENSLPLTLICGEDHRFSYTIPVPDTYEERTDKKGNVTVVAPAIVPDNLSVVAFVVNQESCEIINAVSVPMSEQAEDRFTTRDLVAKVLSVDAAFADTDATTAYYSLQGVKIATPVKGEPFIEVKGGKSRKVIF